MLIVQQANFVSYIGNILNNFPADNVLINIARLAFGLNMFTTIPLEAFVCREVRGYISLTIIMRYLCIRYIIGTRDILLAECRISMVTPHCPDNDSCAYFIDSIAADMQFGHCA